MENRDNVAKAGSLPEVYLAREVARAAGVPIRVVHELIANGSIPTIDGEFIVEHDAAVAVRTLSGNGPRPIDVDGPGPTFRTHAARTRRVGGPLFCSSLIHAAALASIVLLATAGASTVRADREPIRELKPLRLVYLALPGPGGGGGLRQSTPPPKIERKGPPKRLSSPLPRRQPPRRIVAAPRPVEPPKPPRLEHEPLPLLIAPIPSLPADLQERIGVLDSIAARANSRGAGEGGGVGAADGSGLGPGQGPGVGPGSGGGAGGGPYRPGTNVEPPRLLREVKPEYSETARQRGVEGEVVLEIVIRQDGGVGDVRILRSLGYGLDERAMHAVQQWRFSPATRLGTPVAVVVEVAVEFVLR